MREIREARFPFDDSCVDWKEIRNIKGYGNLEVTIWFWDCPRIDVVKILQNNKKNRVAHNHIKLTDYMRSLIKKETLHGILLPDYAMNFIFNKLPEFLIKRRKRVDVRREKEVCISQ